MANLPAIYRVRQSFERPVVDDIEEAIERQLRSLELASSIQTGQSVAITAGSRGIANIAQITRAVVHHFLKIGAAPFIVPAMGSHGGATADGQLQLLAELGITESFCGCPVRGSMQTVQVATSRFGFPIFCDQLACQADHLVVVNRVKPHTAIVGELESGLVKMLLVGLGKQRGAEIFHRAMVDHSFDDIATDVAEQVINRANVVAGIGIVENAHGETAHLEAANRTELIQREKQWLRAAKQLMPRLPFDELDLLIVDRIGKNISGTGLDTNVVGRKFSDHTATDSEKPRIKRIAVRSLTPESRGNATGIGIAEFCRTQLLNDIDRRSTNVNALTAIHPTAAMLPMDFDNDREMIEVAAATIGLTPLERARIVRIRDTLHLTEFFASAALKSMIEGDDQLEITAGPIPMQFGDDGNLPAF